MKSAVRMAGLVVASGLVVGAVALAPLKVEVEKLTDNGPIPEAFALCEATPDGKSTAGKNQRPTISWSKAPKETKSFAVIVSDPDVPAEFSKAGKEGMVIGTDEPRQMFYHWALLDIPATKTRIEGGKPDAPVSFGVPARSDLGSYVPDARNYGGPCPPWNDARVHHYHFTVYALDVPSLGLAADVTAKQAAEAIASSNHVLAQGEMVGTYTLNKELRK